MIEIEGPDGAVIEFPDGTPDADIERAMQQAYPAAQPGAPTASEPPAAPTPAAPAAAPSPTPDGPIGQPPSAAPVGPAPGAGQAPPPIAPSPPVSAPPPAAAAPNDQGFPETGYLTGLAATVANSGATNFLDELVGGANYALSGFKEGEYERGRKFTNDILKRFSEENPKTAIAANLAGAVGSPINRVVPFSGAAGGAFRPIISATTSGALSGLVSGIGRGGDEEDVGFTEGLLDRARKGAIDAGVGGLLGGALGTAFHAIPNIANRGRNAANRMMSEYLSRDLARSDRTSSLRENVNIRLNQIREQIRNSDAPLVLADTGQNVRRGVRTTHNIPSAGSRELEEFLVQRQMGQFGRVREDLHQVVSGSNAVHADRALSAQQRAASAPLYREAYAQGPVYDDRIQRLLDNPTFRQALQRGYRAARDEADARGVPIDATDFAITSFNDAGDPVFGQVPNVRMLDIAKRGLDDIINRSRNEITGRINWDLETRSADMLRRTLLERMDEVVPAYREARAAWAGPAGERDAIASGRSFMKGDIEDVLLNMNDMSPSERQNFVIGIARGIQDKIKPGETGDATRFILQPHIRERLEQVLDSDMFDQLMERMTQEQSTGRTLGMVRGSPTGRIGAEQDDAAATASVAADAASGFIHGGVPGALANVVRRGSNAWRGITEETADELAPMLMTRGDRDLSILQQNLLDDLDRQRAGRILRRGLLTGGVEWTNRDLLGVGED